jgi:alkanesulfonate monooxygenase SsuD/methylene tetrahydromethanopterin reductase-like flavin-dependent oxidoreductase (luciferase family)
MVAAAPIHPWVAEGATRLRFGINAAAAPDWGATRDFVQTAEGLGFDAFTLPDHPAVLPTGTWTTLAALAAATRTIRLGTLVTCVPYWNPVVLARLAADVDRISGGRLVLGLGSGDMPHEFRQLGLAYPPVRERQAVLEEGLRIIPPLLRGEQVIFAGEHFRVEEPMFRTPAVQRPHVPIIVAGGGERTTLRFVAQYADASNLGAASWAGGAFTPADVRHKFAVLRAHCAEAGRPYEAVLRTTQVRLFLAESREAAAQKAAQAPSPRPGFFEQLDVVGTPEEAVAHLRGLAEAGFQYFLFGIGPADRETLQLTAERVIPAVAGG